MTVTPPSFEKLVTEADTAPAVTTQPQNVTKDWGETASFTVAVSGSPTPAIQWQTSSDGGTTWLDASDGQLGPAGPVFSGVETLTFQITGLTHAVNELRVRARATNSAGTAESNAATLTVNPSPVIGTQPKGRAWVIGSNFTLTVDATGLSALTYQWRKDGVDIPGATTASLAFNNAAHADTAAYTVVVTDVSGSVTSAAANVLIIDPIPILSARVSAGQEHTMFVEDDGTLLVAGVNTFHALGTGNETTYPSPVQSATGVSGISTKIMHSLRVDTDGKLWGTGYNLNRQLGVNSAGDFQETWAEIAAAVASAAVGFSHSLFLKQDGTLWAMGSNGNGELGDTTLLERPTPVMVATGVKSVAAGPSHSLFLEVGGNLWGTGINGVGALGPTNLGGSISTPVLLHSGVAAIAAGTDYTLFVTTSGELWGMGINANGQLGDGTTLNRSMPVMIATGVAKVASSHMHSLFLKIDGTLWGMGWNHSSQLGNGGTSDVLTPIMIASDVAEISAGRDHSAFLKTNGELWGMGRGFEGQLGNGSNDSPQTPVQIFIGQPTSDAPAITNQPQSVSVTVGSPASFAVVATGTGTLTYQWRKGGVDIDGATSAAFTIASAQLSDADSYDVVVTNTVAGVSSSATSTNAMLTVTATAVMPSITTHPTNLTVTEGQPASFSVDATGTAPLTYQWRKGGAIISGATSSGYNIASAVMGDAGSYDVVVTNGQGSVTSAAATLTVEAAPVAPTITTQPEGQDVTIGQSVSFTVAVTGTAPLAYQWLHNGVEISGATDATYTIGSVRTDDAGQYAVVVSNVAGSKESFPAFLFVDLPGLELFNDIPDSMRTCAADAITWLFHALLGLPQPESSIRSVERTILKMVAEATGLDLDVFRRFRDEVLSTTPAGRYYTDLYERLSPGTIDSLAGC